MTILHILSSDDIYGSAQCFKELVSEEIKKSDINCIVITPIKNAINVFCDEHDIKNYTLNYEQCLIPKHDVLPVFLFKYILHGLRYILINRVAAKKIVDIVRKYDVQVIHTNSSVIDVGAIVSKKTNVKHVWHIREFGKADFNMYSLRPYSYLKMMNHKNCFPLFISDAVKISWQKKGVKNSRSIYDGIETNKVVQKKDYLKGDILKIVFCGSFCEAKGQFIAVEAMCRLKQIGINNLELHFYGKCKGKYYEEIYEYVKKNNLEEQVYFKGYCNSIYDILNQYDVGLVCSKAEGFGRVTIEYMAAGLCCVASNSGANVEIIEKNEAGLLYNNSCESLVDVFRYLIDNRQCIEEYGKRAADVAREMYDINKNADKIIDYISNC